MMVLRKLVRQVVRQSIPDNELSGLPYEVPSGLKSKTGWWKKSRPRHQPMMVFKKLVRRPIPDNELSGLPYEVPSGLKGKTG